MKVEIQQVKFEKDGGEVEVKREHHPRWGEQEIQPASESGVLRWLQRKGLPFRVAVGLLDGARASCARYAPS